MPASLFSRSPAGIGPGPADQVLDAAHRRLRIRHDVVGGDQRDRHRREVLLDVVAAFLEEQRVQDEDLRRADQQRVTVGRGFGDFRRADLRRCAGLVLHHHRLAEGLLQLLSDRAAGQVRGAAGAVGHHQAQRFGRIVLCVRLRGDSQGEQPRDDACFRLHVVSSTAWGGCLCVGAAGVATTIDGWPVLHRWSGWFRKCRPNAAKPGRSPPRRTPRACPVDRRTGP